MPYKEYFVKGRLERVYVCESDGKCIVDTQYPGLSDNQCEWKALVKILDYILTTFGDSGELFFINLDSKLVYKQLMSKTSQRYEGKTYSIKSKSLHPIYLEWNILKNKLWDTTIKYIYVSRLHNLARGCLNNECESN